MNNYRTLRTVIRKIILEALEETELPYEDTVMPGDPADEELLAEPDLADQKARNKFIKSKEEKSAKKKSTRVKLRSRDETPKGTSDEHAIVGVVGPAWGDQSGNGPGDKPYGKPLKSKNAMGDEHDE